jgi:hypothetical protein
VRFVSTSPQCKAKHTVSLVIQNSSLYVFQSPPQYTALLARDNVFRDCPGVAVSTSSLQPLLICAIITPTESLPLAVPPWTSSLVGIQVQELVLLSDCAGADQPPKARVGLYLDGPTFAVTFSMPHAATMMTATFDSKL